jgi:signal transduction histidine kinase/ActR/RegA family two-component response regulator
MAEFLRTRESTLLKQAQVMTGRRKNGQLFSLRMTFSEMRVDEDILYVTVMQDFSGTENTQKLLSQAKEKAEEDRQLRGEFLAKMSYEIRTPMNGIVGMTELAMDTPDRAEQKEYLTLARNSANHLLHIINQILDFSKIEANALKLALQDVSPGQWLEKSVEDMVPWARAKNIDLLTDLSPQLPLLVRMDPVRMQQVLTNLIGNAIKFTDLGAVTVAMQAHSADSAQKCVLRISITDTGKGFDSSRSASLFNPFNQVDDSDKRIFGSTGLGLAITRSLVHLMGGEIIANSQPELGACFTVALPVDLVAMAPEQVRLLQGQLDKQVVSKDRGLVPMAEAIPLMAQSMTTRQGEQVSVLLVEDHEINRKLAEIMIERMGCRLVSVRDGLQALDAMDKSRFDVVLMDVMMPVMDGLAALKLVREREEGTGFRSRVLMVTAHAMAGDRERFLSAGADGYVSKPMSQASLQTEIERVLALDEGKETIV